MMGTSYQPRRSCPPPVVAALIKVLPARLEFFQRNLFFQAGPEQVPKKAGVLTCELKF